MSGEPSSGTLLGRADALSDGTLATKPAKEILKEVSEIDAVEDERYAAARLRLVRLRSVRTALRNVRGRHSGTLLAAPSRTATPVAAPYCLFGIIPARYVSRAWERSGTSLAASVVEALGVDLGDHATMLPANEHDNARGYWEHDAIFRFNERLLQTFGGTWESPPKLPQDWHRIPALDEARLQARRILAELGLCREGVRWGWKDPRASLTIPFWRDLVGDMDFVICVRNPADVAASIARRGAHDLDFRGSVALWLRYISAALENTQGSRRIVLLSEDLLADPGRQIARLGEFVGAFDSQVRTVQRNASELIEPRLWHHREREAGTARVGDVCPDAADLYLSLVTGVKSSRERRARAHGRQRWRLTPWPS